MIVALSARFRPGAARRPFVDREPVISAFDAALARMTAPDREPQVMVLTGVGGIGKSRLLAELGRRASDRRYPTATLDLQVPAQRQPETALAVLRSQFGADGVKFSRFDIAYTVLWQRLHPHLRFSAESLALARYSEILTEILDDASGVPVFGTAAKLIESGTRRLHRWRWMRQDPTLQELDLLTLPALTDAVAYLFAEDLKKSDTYVLFVDAYEALVGGAPHHGSIGAVDAWLRDIVAQLDTGLVVVASREPIAWGRYEPEWRNRLVSVPIGDLPVPARMQLLASAGIEKRDQATSIALSSEGLPFYLNLAVDELQSRRTGDASPASVVSREAILERFLLHVHPAQVRILELLSVSRTIDREIFETLTSAFGLVVGPDDWEAVVGYSFVRQADRDDRFQLHQLMVEALRRRLDSGTVRMLHGELYDLWARRSGAGGTEALREAVFHGVHSERLDAPGLLRLADQIAGSGGVQALAQVSADLEEYLAGAGEGGSAGFEQAAAVVRADAAILLGDAVAADRITSDVDLRQPGEVADRLVVAAAHARRILGRTAEARELYETVSRRAPDGPVRANAGLWAADLHMAQGRFGDAMELTEELLARARPDDAQHLCDIDRLRSLICRFAFDPGRAARHLDRAMSHNATTGSVVARANLAVNRAELLAIVDPVAGVRAAGEAIELQRELGAAHEIGKAYTALGLARIFMGELAAAEQALTDAQELLDRVGYRSGFARAELYLAMISARRGDRPDAVARAVRAVDELERVGVYPGLIVAADVALALLGWHDPAVGRAALRARTVLQELPGSPALSAGANALVAAMLGVDPVDAYRAAAQADSAAGFYNHNVRHVGPFGAWNVRIPVRGADQMDLRVVPEADVLRALSSRGVSVPRLRWASDDPRFQIHDHVDGALLNAVAPRGTELPPHVITDVVELLAALPTVPRSALGRLPADWPDDSDVAAVARRLSGVTAGVVRRHHDEFSVLWSALGIPSDPLAGVVAGWGQLTSRPFRLVHADLHRKNMVIAAGRVVFLDWELAMWGDPLYDVATHLHKMTYLEAEERFFLDGWLRAEVPAIRTSASWRADLQIYLNHERVKSALVDSVRYAKLIRSGSLAPDAAEQLVRSMVTKLSAARRVWGLTGDPDPDAVRAALRGA